MTNMAGGTPVPQTTYDMTTVDRARDVEYGRSAFATTPPDAAATTDVTIGRSQAEATDSGVCL
jgi:hypothetical protein